MTIPAISDPGLPGLEWAPEQDALAKSIDTALCEATATAWRCQAISIARFRYRAGCRAILQLDLTLSGPNGQQQDVPGALWLYNGNKAKDEAERITLQDPTALPALIFEPQTSGLLTLFPYDRRVPQIANFIATSGKRAVGLTGSESHSRPELARYRPGLGATFRWQTERGTSFVKIFKDRSASERYAELADLSCHLQSQPLATPIPQGFDDDLGILALKRACGTPLAKYLDADDHHDLTSALDVVLGGLEALNHLDISPRKKIGSEDFLKRGQAVVRLLSAVDNNLRAEAVQALDALTTSQPPLRSAPSHADMKIEHVLIDGKVACLLDLDSVALCDPLYDPAMLAARIELAGLEGNLPAKAARQAMETIRHATPAMNLARFDWLFSIARFQTARFLVQNMRPDWGNHVSTLMRGVIARVSDPVLCG